MSAILQLSLVLLAAGVLAGGAVPAASGGESSLRILPAADLEFLSKLTAAVVEASRVKSGATVGNAPSNTCGFTLIMPGGRGSYPAFWIRDFAMSLESGFITPEEMLQHLRLAARCQNGPAPRLLLHGLTIPAFAIPDHVNFDGTAAFYPGSYSTGNDQGMGAYGILPPIDDHYEFVHIACCLYRSAGKADFLNESVNGMTFFDRLEAAFKVPTVDSASGLVTTDDAHRAVGFGFCDAIYITGKMLFPSLLRYRAAGELAVLSTAAGKKKAASEYRKIQKQIAQHVGRTFADPPRLEGWLMSATEVGRQADVWGTLYALHLDVLTRAEADRALQTVARAARDGTITFEAAVRHVPTNLNASASSAWERTAGVMMNRYQNGAYWHTPAGWLIEALQRTNPQLAAKISNQYITHLRENDFRLGPGHNGPWECLAPDGYAQNGIYMTSVTVPWSVLRPKQ